MYTAPRLDRPQGTRAHLLFGIVSAVLLNGVRLRQRTPSFPNQRIHRRRTTCKADRQHAKQNYSRPGYRNAGPRFPSSRDCRRFRFFLGLGFHGASRRRWILGSVSLALGNIRAFRQNDPHGSVRSFKPVESFEFVSWLVGPFFAAVLGRWLE